jgi:peptidoglycan/LPS O-acetylase OafA/YrhL
MIVAKLVGKEEGASGMERLTMQQRWIIAVVALIVAVACLVGFIYWVAIVENHPWFKHWLLCAVLAIGSLAIAAYAWPRTPRTE